MTRSVLRDMLVFSAFAILTAAMTWPWAAHLRDACSDPALRSPRRRAVLPQMGDCTRAGFEARFELDERDEGTHQITAVFLSRDGRCRIYPSVLFSWLP